MAVQRQRAEEAQILEAIIQRLIDEFEELSESTCFLSDSPNPLNAPPGNFFCTVTPGDGMPGDGETDGFQGASSYAVTEHQDITITVYSREALDRVDHYQHALLGEERGILKRYKKRLIQTMLIDNPNASNRVAWEPVYKTTRLLRNQIRYRGAGRPEVMESGQGWTFIMLPVRFRIVFDWDLIGENA